MLRAQRSIRTAFVAALAAVVMVACGDDGATTGPVTVDTDGVTLGVSAGSRSLLGTQWLLVQLVGGPELPDAFRTTPPHLRLQGATATTMSGSTGCNSFGGDVNVSGPQLSVGNFETTILVSSLVGCTGTIESVEDAFFGVLDATRTFSVVGDVLTLRNAEGRPLAVFTASVGE